jgi:hypothetical protein
MLLPYVEQTAIFTEIAEKVPLVRPDALASNPNANDMSGQINTGYVNYNPVPWNAGTAAEGWNHYAANIAAFLCPSDPQGSESGQGTNGFTSYHCSRGDSLWVGYNIGPENVRGPLVVGAKTVSDTNDRFVSAVTMGFEGISDGSSNTILLSEMAIGRRPSGTAAAIMNTNTIRGGIAANTPRTDSDFAPINCLKMGLYGVFLRPAAGNIPYAGSQDPANATAPSARIGGRWSDAHHPYTQFYTILPPNSPSCSANTDLEASAIYSASSYHFGGVNTVFGDGGVKFVSDDIQVENLDSVPPATPAYEWFTVRKYTGPGYWGLWSQLGTRNGGESVAMP